ncbi:hypothetical protein K488DRAFT_92059 [Vararia minispora EC-137]|uniref:Uncharacterized protein n=1 Tax=Vararia minispora EC-137 TaxID=1314806 RepID=A0ACB8Q502_9AGAM|nr:hypothetical protein K488DRAFT_92059 [Vararia minispora EC-137]
MARTNRGHWDVAPSPFALSFAGLGATDLSIASVQTVLPKDLANLAPLVPNSINVDIKTLSLPMNTGSVDLVGQPCPLPDVNGSHCSPDILSAFSPTESSTFPPSPFPDFAFSLPTRPSPSNTTTPSSFMPSRAPSLTSSRIDPIAWGIPTSLIHAYGVGSNNHSLDGFRLSTPRRNLGANAPGSRLCTTSVSFLKRPRPAPAEGNRFRRRVSSELVFFVSQADGVNVPNIPGSTSASARLRSNTSLPFFGFLIAYRPRNVGMYDPLGVQDVTMSSSQSCGLDQIDEQTAFHSAELQHFRAERNAIIPISRLLPELLSEVFRNILASHHAQSTSSWSKAERNEFWSFDPDVAYSRAAAATALSHVCRLWRTVARTDLLLWTEVWITRHYWAWRIRMLERSRVSPPTVRLHIPSPHPVHHVAGPLSRIIDYLFCGTSPPLRRLTFGGIDLPITLPLLRIDSIVHLSIVAIPTWKTGSMGVYSTRESGAQSRIGYVWHLGTNNALPECRVSLSHLEWLELQDNCHRVVHLLEYICNIPSAASVRVLTRNGPAIPTTAPLPAERPWDVVQDMLHAFAPFASGARTFRLRGVKQIGGLFLSISLWPVAMPGVGLVDAKSA